MANTITAIDNGIKSAGIKGGIAELFNDAKNIINDGFQKINKIISVSIPYIVGLLNTLGPIIRDIGPVVATMGGGFLSASAGVWAFNKATSAVSSTLMAIANHPVIAILFLLGTAFVSAYNNVKPFHDWVDKTAKKIKDFAEEVSKNKDKMDALKTVLENLAGAGAVIILAAGFVKFKKALEGISKAPKIDDKLKGFGDNAEKVSKGTSTFSNSLLKVSLAIGIISISLAALALALTGLAKTGSSGALVVGVFGVAIAGIIATLGVFGPVLNASSVGLAALSLLFISIGGAIFIASAGITMVIDAISRLIEILNNANQAGENAKILLQSIGEGFALMILTFIATIEDNVPIIVQKFIDMLIQVFNTIGANAPLIVEAFTDMIVNMINAISNNLGRVVDAATNLVITLMNSLADNALRLVDSGLDLLDKVLHGITDNLHKLTDTAISFVERLAFEIGYAAGRLLASGTTLVDNVIDGFKSGYSRGGGLGSGFVNEIANGIKPSSLFHSGKAIIDGLIDGVKSAWNTGKKIFEDITKAIPKLKGPYSYDKVLLTPAGNAIMDGLNNGIMNGYKTVKSNLSGMADDLESNFSGQLNANATQTSRNVSQIEVTANNSTNGLLREVVKAIREGQIITINGNQMIGATANGYDGALGDIMTDRRRNQL
ncbi:Phage-related protein [Fructobacillus tropaeoli]|nr:Phage-related protein [Fructobacillus tropaeoli]